MNLSTVGIGTWKTLTTTRALSTCTIDVYTILRFYSA